jgi:acyl-CoA synthetase
VTTLAEVVARNAARNPDGIAFVEGASGTSLTWRQYDERARAIAATLAASYERGDRVALQISDGPDVHVAMLACELAGVIAVGIGTRAGTQETAHIVERTGARDLLRELPNATGGEHSPRGFDAEELSFLNSTSGTTGLPKIVMHNEARWFAFHEFAHRVARFTADDVFASALPAPFGFGLWTAHYTPAIVGAPCIVFERFTPEVVCEAIARYRVTVLAAVSTQFMMMLNSPAFTGSNLSSLRILFTGGEMVPYERAREFEERTGAYVLQFYGSNETGALSCTTPEDPPERRLQTAGRVIPEMHVRLLDVDHQGQGVPAGKGPTLCLGYWDDPDANAQLVTPDGWMRMGDLATIDRDGYLTVTGRASDFIIRGGKNISAARVEEEVGAHPAVVVCAVVAMPDAVFGERACAFVELAPGAALDLDALNDFLRQRGTSKELWPERLVVLGSLPRASGGKVAKGELRESLRSS